MNRAMLRLGAGSRRINDRCIIIASNRIKCSSIRSSCRKEKKEEMIFLVFGFLRFKRLDITDRLKNGKHSYNIIGKQAIGMLEVLACLFFMGITN